MAVTLRLRQVTEADAKREWIPAEFYDILADGGVVGTIQLRLGNLEYMRLYGGHVGASSRNIAAMATRAGH